MQFTDKIKQQYIQLNEEFPPDLENNDLGAAAPPEGAPPADEAPEPAAPLSAEAEVLYIRMIKKALAMEIEPEAVSELNQLEDINASNAKQVFEKLLSVMERYSTDIDTIDTI